MAKTSLVLQPGETLLRRDMVSLVEGRIVKRVGTCFLTDRRIVVLSEPLLLGVAAVVAILMRVFLRKARSRSQRRDEIALPHLTRLTLSRYGIRQSLDIALDNGRSLRLMMGGRQQEAWLATLEQALQAHDRRLVSTGPTTWQVRPRWG